eukprot:gene13340-9172_t
MNQVSPLQRAEEYGRQSGKVRAPLITVGNNSERTTCRTPRWLGTSARVEGGRESEHSASAASAASAAFCGFLRGCPTPSCVTRS